jgi:alanine dehydrogenase
VAPAKVVVLGGGVVGENAIMMALGMGADVAVLDRKVDVLSRLSRQFGPALKTVYSTQAALEAYVLEADLVIGAVLVAGAEAPKLVRAPMLKEMKRGTVLVDVAIDQGGCFETSRPTTHADPIYTVDGIVHYCVANMPGAVPSTSTYALNNVTLPYGLALADKGYARALLDNPNFCEGLNVCFGKVTYRAVAEDLGYDYTDPASLLQATRAPRAIGAA